MLTLTKNETPPVAGFPRQVKQNYFINYVYKINKSMTEQQQAKMIDDLQFLKIIYNNSSFFFPHCRIVTFLNIFHFSHIPPGNETTKLQDDDRVFTILHNNFTQSSYQ